MTLKIDRKSSESFLLNLKLVGECWRREENNRRKIIDLQRAALTKMAQRKEHKEMKNENLLRY